MVRLARLLFIIPDGWPTHRADVAVLFGKELPRRGIESDLVAQAQSDEPVGWQAGEAFLCRKTGRRARDQLTGFLHDFRTLWGARGERYDGIQVRDKVFAGLLGLMCARRMGKPFFFWMSYPMSEASIAFSRSAGMSLGVARWAFVALKGHLGKWLIYRVLLPRCNHVFVQSDRMLEDVAAQGIPRRLLTAVPMAVDMEQVPRALDQVVTAPPALRGRRVIGYLGILDRGRRIDFLFEVLLAVRRTMPDACLLLVGDATEASDRRWLESRAQELGVQHDIVWTGWVPTHTAWGLLRDVDVAISLFPRGELLDSASPTKVVEYLALGLPVVANDQPDQHQVLTESGAGVSVKMDVDSFAAAIIRILGDTDLQDQMRAAGPAYVARRRSYALIGRRVAEAYMRLLPVDSSSRRQG